MRYSAISVFEAAGTRLLKKYLNIQDYDLENEFKRGMKTLHLFQKWKKI